MVRGILGNVHQGCEIFRPFNGMQCTAIALIALLTLSVDYNAQNMTASRIDSILHDGTELYASIVHSINRVGFLGHRDLPSTVRLQSTYCNVNYLTDMFYGPVNNELTTNMGQTHFYEAFSEAIRISSSLLLTLDSTTVAVHVDVDRSNYFLFDSHQRNGSGLFSEDGAAVFLQFDTLDDIVIFVLDNYGGSAYELTPVLVENELAVSNSFDNDRLHDQHKNNSDNSILQFKQSLSDHSYSTTERKLWRAKKKSAGRARKQKKKAVVNKGTENQNENIEIYPSVPLFQLLNVAYMCEIETSVNLTFLDFEVLENHFFNYEHAIRLGPIESCACCNKFLFDNQTYRLSKLTEVSESISIQAGEVLCSYCKDKLRKNVLPSISRLGNFLNVCTTPMELKTLSSLERKMVALVNVFMTIVMLPGGQYAEKGLVLNLPSNVVHTVSQLPMPSTNCSHVIVHFDKETNIPSEVNARQVSLFKIKEALNWLVQHNHLYTDITINNDSLLPSCSNQSISSNISLNQVYDESVLIPTNSYHTSAVNCQNVSPSITIPENHNKPVNILNISFGEEKAFPWLFPNGKYGFNFPRPVKIHPSMYFKARLYDNTGVFRKNITYLLHSAVCYDVFALKREIGISMQIRKSVNGSDANVNAGHIKHLNQHSDLLENSYMFMKNIKGTVAYFRNMLYNLLATFRCLGPPTLFMTLSADDLHWPELGMCLENLSFQDAYGKSFFTSMKNDPLLTATHFERRFKALMKHVILSAKQPLGHVQDYFARVEFQNRGSPHIHMFLWVSDVPFVINEQTAPSVLKYIDKCISSEVPNESEDPELHGLVKRLQTHQHSPYCTKRSGCRFGFPKQVCSLTQLIRNLHVNAKNKGRFYVTKRDSDSRFINDYNPTILRHWRANMDIQLIQNAEGAAFYVCSYLCKSEPDDLKNALANLISTLCSTDQNIPKHVRLLKIGLCVLKHRRMSAQEAAYRMGNLNLMHSTRAVVYLNTRPLNKRFKKLKPRSEIELMPDDCTEIFCSNLLDYYHDRPFSLETYSFYRFASWFTKIPKFTGGSEKFYCSSYNVWFRKNKKFQVVRFPKFPYGSYDYYYSMLLLLVPHRDENSLFEGFNSIEQAFNEQQHLFDEHVDHVFFSLTAEIENAVRRIRMCENEMEEPLDHENDISTEDICSFTLPSSNESAGATSCFDNADIIDMHSLESCIMSVDDFNTKVKKMTKCQLNVLDHVKTFFSSNSRDSMHLFITGGAGVGKSFVTEILIAYIQLFTSSAPGISPVVICAPTGTAAKNIHGTTIHSLLKIPVSQYLEYEDLSPHMLSKLQRQFLLVHTIIIDEISMVSDRMLTYISRRLSDIKNNPSAFGNMNVILIGDFFQLRPISGKFAFENSLLWNLFYPMFLRQNMRQSGDKHYATLLNRARLGCLNSADINLLLGRLQNASHITDSCLHIFPLTKDVNEHNSKMQATLPQGLLLNACHFFASSDYEPGADVPSDLIPKDDRDAGNLDSCLSLSPGTRVMLIRNIYTSHGLVNGALGTVKSFTFSDVGNVESVNVLFNDSSIGQILQMANLENAISIDRVEHTFMTCGRHIIRSQFPLTLAWACTIHKVQGLSLEKVAVDIGSSVFQRGMAYVALSRARSLSGLYLLRFDPSVVLPPIGVLEEYERLRNKK